MDDSLLEDFQSTFLIGGAVNDPRAAPHPNYAARYKQKREGFGEQAARRLKQLEEQKARRRNFADYARRLVEGGLEDDDEMDEDDASEVDSVEMKSARKKHYRRPYRNQLMLSEWLVDVPEDFLEKWFVVVCPIGKRSLIISSNGTTYAHSRSGSCLNTFPSLLPGGCHKTYRTSRDHCILDCIFDNVTRTYYVLDIMCWNGHPFYDSDTEFRSFWAKTKLIEEKERISVISKINPYQFKSLDYHPCSGESLTSLLASKWPVPVDGLLFIHKEAHYTPSRSPLAMWLKPHMVTDILGVPVSQDFLSCAPVMSDATSKPKYARKKPDEVLDKSTSMETPPS